MDIPPRRIARVRGVITSRLQSVVVIAEAVHRRHNTSAILRSAEAFGLHEVHLVTGEFKPSRGAARGAERWLDLHRHATIQACADQLHARGFKLYVADLDEHALAPEEVPVDQPVALLFGAELTGVSDAARALADGVITVPMRGLTESLNVSVAAACAIRPVAERRRALLGGGDLDPARAEAFIQAWMVREQAVRDGMRARLE